MSHDQPNTSPAESLEGEVEEPSEQSNTASHQPPQSEGKIVAMSSTAFLDDIDLDNDELNYDEEEEMDHDGEVNASGEVGSRAPTISTEEEGQSQSPINGAEGRLKPPAPEKITAVSDSEEGEISDDEEPAESRQRPSNADSPSHNSTRSSKETKAHRPSVDLEEGELESDSDDGDVPVVRDESAAPVGSVAATSATNEVDSKGRRAIRPPDGASGDGGAAVGGDGVYGREQIAIACKFHIRGECQYGDDCRYYHPTEPERSRLRAKYQQRSLLIGGGGIIGYSTMQRPFSRQVSIPSLLSCPTAAPRVGSTAMRSAPVVPVSSEASAWARGLKQARAIVNKRAGKSTDETEESGEGKLKKTTETPSGATTRDSNGRRLPSLIDGIASRVTGKRRASSRSPSRSPPPSGGRLRSRVAEVIRAEPSRDTGRRRDDDGGGGWRRRDLPERTHRIREASLPKAEQISDDDSPSPDRDGVRETAPTAKSGRSPSPKRRRRSKSPLAYGNVGRGRRRDVDMSPIRQHKGRGSRDRHRPDIEISPIRERGRSAAEHHSSVSPERHRHHRHRSSRGESSAGGGTSFRSLLHQRGSSGEERASRRDRKSRDGAPHSPENKKRIYDWDEDAPAAYSTATTTDGKDSRKAEGESGSSSLQALRERLRRKRRRRRSDSSASRSSHSSSTGSSSASADSTTEKKRRRRGSARDTKAGKSRGKSPLGTPKAAKEAEPVSSAEEEGARVKNPPKTPPTPSGDVGPLGNGSNDDEERQPPPPQSPPPAPLPPSKRVDSSSKRQSKEEMLQELKEVEEKIARKRRRKQKSGDGDVNADAL